MNLDDDIPPLEKTSPMMSVREEQDNLVLKKAPEAIFMKPVSGEMTPLMHKAFNAILARAAKQGVDKREFVIDLRQLVKDTKYTSRDMMFFRECIKKLNVFQVEWDVFSGGKRRGWGVTTLLAEAEIVDHQLRCSFSNKIHSQLLVPEVYQNINIGITSMFRSRPAMALYEACLRYATAPDGLTVKRPWREWRDMLCGPTVQVNEWRYFRRDTLQPALEEITRLADDIEIEAIIYKDGRTVTDLQFKVNRKKQATLNLGNQDENLLNMELFNRLMTLGFGEKEASAILMKHDEGRVGAVAAFVEEKRRKGRADNPVALFKDALRKGYGEPSEEKPAALPPASKPIEKPDPEALQRVQAVAEAIERFQSLPAEEKAALWGEYVKQAGVNMDLATRRGLDSKIVRSAFGQWLIKRK